MGRISKWFPPFTGIILAALFVIIPALGGQGQDPTDKTAQQIAAHYNDHFGKELTTAILIGVAAIVALVFGGWLRRVLKDGEGPEGILSAVAFGGAVVFAAGAAVEASVHFTLADLADNIDPIALSAINGIDFDTFFFFPVGLGSMILVTGISAVRHRSLPRWLAWASVVLGVIFVIPVTFWTIFFVGPIWFLVVSIIGIRSALKSPDSGAGPAPATA